MPNIAVALREEIARVATRVTRQEVRPVRSSSTTHRKHIADLRRQVQELQKQVTGLTRQLAKVRQPQHVPETTRIRFSAKGLLAQRNRLNLSQGAFGRLLGVSTQTVGNWEGGHTSPRSSQLPAIAAMRKMGKREALAKLNGQGA